MDAFNIGRKCMCVMGFRFELGDLCNKYIDVYNRKIEI